MSQVVFFFLNKVVSFSVAFLLKLFEITASLCFSLDANRDADLSPARSKFEDLDFDQLLKQAQRGMKR